MHFCLENTLIKISLNTDYHIKIHKTIKIRCFILCLTSIQHEMLHNNSPGAELALLLVSFQQFLKELLSPRLIIKSLSKSDS